MTQNIIRSGMPHAVSTSAVTNDAINPRNKFVESDNTSTEKEPPTAPPKQITTEADSSLSKPVHPPIVPNPEHAKEDKSYTSNEHFVEPKVEIKNNFQKLNIEKPIDDNKFHESLERIEDRLRSIRDKQQADNLQKVDATHLSDNYQRRNSKTHLEDNRQKLDSQTYTDNFQKLGSKTVYEANRQPVDDGKTMPINRQKIDSETYKYNDQGAEGLTKIEKNLSFQGKKNIKDSFQSVDQSVTRHRADLVVPALTKSETQSGQGNVPTEAMETDEFNEILNGSLGSANEDELRAKIKQMKEKLGKANRSLIDIEQENDSFQDD